MRNDKENLIVKLSFEFALDILEFSESLEANRKFVLANQILKAETSIGAILERLKMLKAKMILFIK